MTMDKTESQEKKEKTYQYVTLRDNTNQVIMKVESLLPTYIESFTNIQEEYLRIARDFFGTCIL